MDFYLFLHLIIKNQNISVPLYMQKFFALVLLFMSLGAAALGNETRLLEEKQDTSLLNKAEHYIIKANDYSKDSITLALSFADQAIKIYNQFNGSDSLKARALKVKGELLHDQGELQYSIRMLNEAIALAKEGYDTTLALLIHKKLGTIYLNLKNYKTAIEHFEGIMEYKDSLRNPALYASVSADLGLIYSNFKDYSVALDHYQTALKYYNTQHNYNQSADLLKEIAGIYYIQDSLDEALNYFNQSITLQKSFASPSVIANTLKKIGSIYLKMKKSPLAVSYLSESLQMKKRQKDTTDLIGTYLMLGQAYFENESFGLAEESFQNSLKLAKNLKDKNAEAESLKYLADIYDIRGFQKKGVQYFKSYVALKDSLLDVENKKAIAAIRSEFEVENKGKAIEILEQQKELLSSQARTRELEMESNRNLLILLTVMIVLGILVIMLMIHRHNAKKSINEMLQRHLSEMSEQKEETAAQRDTIKQSNFKLEEAQNTIIKQNKKLKHTNDLLEKTVSDRTLELYKAYKKLAFHVDNTSLAVMEFNRKLEVTRWSEQAENIFGWKAGDVLGLFYDQVGFILEKDLDEFRNSFNVLLRGEKTKIFSTGNNYNKFGDLLFVEWNISILHNEDGSVDSILAIANDVTSREKAFNDLQDSNRDLDNFIYKASHDLRGPLARIQGIVNLGLMESRENTSRDYFNLLDSTASDLDTILSRLLMIYDVNHHKKNIEPLHVYDEIKQTLEKVIKNKKIKNFTYKINIPRDFIFYTDKVLFQIIVENIFDNALFYKDKREKRPQIVFNSETFYNNRVVFEVTDNGLGIPDDREEQIFDMFFHGSAKSGGTGLGLYMSKKVVERMGGNIKLLKARKDTIFKIILPEFEGFAATNEPPLLEIAK